MRHFLEAGDETRALEAFRLAERWISPYASQATTGGEGAALSLECDRFEDPSSSNSASIRSPNHEYSPVTMNYLLPAAAIFVMICTAPATPHVQSLLCSALACGNCNVTNAITHHAPHLISDAERITALVTALQTEEIYGGFAEALDQVVEFHPPEIVDELWRGVLVRDGATAVHFAAMLLFVYGQTKEPFDGEHCPFFLRFNTGDMVERRQLFCEISHRVGVDAEAFLARLG